MKRVFFGERILLNEPTDNSNELYVDPDIIVLAILRSRASPTG